MFSSSAGNILIISRILAKIYMEKQASFWERMRINRIGKESVKQGRIQNFGKGMGSKRN